MGKVLILASAILMVAAIIEAEDLLSLDLSDFFYKIIPQLDPIH